MTMPICAVYARVSTDHQGDSVDHQISLMKSVAGQYGSDWIVDERFLYRDDGKSGTSIVNRTAVQKLLTDAESGLFDIVMFKGISRFARDVVDAVTMLRVLRSVNVRVISFEESFDSARSVDDVIFTIHATIAEQESKKIGIRTKLGLREVAKKGQWPKGRPPYGYVIDKKTKHLAPHPEQSLIVQMVFDMYVNKGFGMVTIAKYLNNHGIHPNFKEHWSEVTVRLLLINEAYLGRIVYGKRKIIKKYNKDDPSKPKTVNIIDRNGKDVIVVDNAHTALVDEYTFETAQSIIKSRRIERKRGDRHLLVGLLKCAKCNTGMITHDRKKVLASGERKTYRYYACATRRKYGTSICNGRTIAAERLESRIIATLKRTFASYTIEEIREQVMSDIIPTKLDPNEYLAHIEVELADIQNQIVNANMKNAKGIISDVTLAFIVKRLEDDQSKLENARIDVLSRINDASDEEKQLDVFLRSVDRFKKLDKVTSDNLAESRLILQNLVKKIVVDDNDKLKIHLRYTIRPKLPAPTENTSR